MTVRRFFNYEEYAKALFFLCIFQAVFILGHLLRPTECKACFTGERLVFAWVVSTLIPQTLILFFTEQQQEESYGDDRRGGWKNGVPKWVACLCQFGLLLMFERIF